MQQTPKTQTLIVSIFIMLTARGFIYKNTLNLLFLILLTSCTSVATYKTRSIDTSRKPTVRLRIKYDTDNFSENLSIRIQRLGFKVIQDSAGQPEYFADVDYATYFDVVHQTFTRFEINFVDAKTNESLVRSRYLGRIGFNGCDAAMDLVFKDLSLKIK